MTLLALAAIGDALADDLSFTRGLGSLVPIAAITRSVAWWQSSSEPPEVSVGCVLLTMGRRPESLRLALGSLLAQGVETDIVVVGCT